jgi:hypothetical protein
MQHPGLLEQYTPTSAISPQGINCVNLQDLLWEDPEFKLLLELLEKDGDVAYMVCDLKAICTALANPFKQLNFSDP